MSKSRIAWTDHTWNPVTGCSHVSPGCDNCYAEVISTRFAGKKGWGPKDDPFKVTMHPDRVERPGFPKTPSRIFLCSMGDLFHRDVPDIFIESVFSRIKNTPQHTFQLLTKRPARMCEFIKGYDHVTGYYPVQNLWLGVTAENQEQADKRIPILLDTSAALRFVSCEPLLGPIDLRPYLPQLDWVIIGGETGPCGRDMKMVWVVSLILQCHDASVPVFFKQWGTGGCRKRPPITEDQQQFPSVKKGSD